MPARDSQVLPHMQASCANASRALDLSEQLVASMPKSWRDSGLPNAAAPFRTFVVDLQSRVNNARHPDPEHVKRIARLFKTFSN